MKKLLLACLILAATALSLSAIPAKPGRIRYTQPDGSVITIMRHGDEWGHWTTDDKGRVVRQDADGWYRVVPNADVRSVRLQAAQRRANVRGRHPFYPAPGHRGG